MKSITITLALMGILAGGCTTSATVPETKEPEKETPSQQEENTEKETTEMTNPFNFETKTVKLNSGWEMPIIGIGTYYLSTAPITNTGGYAAILNKSLYPLRSHKG